MKIATFNVNNINNRLANLLAWLRSAKPDVVALQELKAPDAEFPKTALEKAGYGAVWRGEKSWNGVAILARGCEPILTRTHLPDEGADAQSRYIEAAVRGVLITSVYAPNGNPQPGPKFAHKLAWMRRLAAHAEGLYSAGIPVVLAGDYNVVPTDRDIYPTKSYAKDALLQPQSRALFQRILDQGWVDAIRTRHPDAPMYTFWDYMRNRWARDAGLRIDHLLLSAQAAARLIDAGVDRAVRAREGASDHAPVWVVLRDEAKARRTFPRPATKPAPASRKRKPPPPRKPLLVTSLPRQSPPRRGAAAPRSSPAGIATPSSLPRPAPRFFFPCARARSRGSVRPRFVRATASIRSRLQISSRCAATPPTSCRGSQV